MPNKRTVVIIIFSRIRVSNRRYIRCTNPFRYRLQNYFSCVCVSVHRGRICFFSVLIKDRWCMPSEVGFLFFLFFSMLLDCRFFTLYIDVKRTVRIMSVNYVFNYAFWKCADSISGAENFIFKEFSVADDGLPVKRWRRSDNFSFPLRLNHMYG